MKIARVTGTVTATVKDSRLVAHPLLIVDVEDARGKLIQSSLIAVDTLGAGVGQMVLIATGSAARVPAGLQGVAIDASIVAIIDEISIGN